VPLHAGSTGTGVTRPGRPPRRPALPPGKLSAALLRELLADGPALPPEVRVPPAIGEDASAIDIERGTLIAATDPITLTGTGVGGHAVIVNANDVAVMGARPRWFLAAMLLPPATREEEVRALFGDTRAALARVGAALVGGHTEITEVVSQPVVVGQMLGWCERGSVISTGGMGLGDTILQVGPAPVEGAAVLARHLRNNPRAGIAPQLLARALTALDDPGISVVTPPRVVSPPVCTNWPKPLASRSASRASRCCGLSPGLRWRRPWVRTPGARWLPVHYSPRFRRNDSPLPAARSKRRVLHPARSEWPGSATGCFATTGVRFPATTATSSPGCCRTCPPS
jgi:hypothetical protein